MRLTTLTLAAVAVVSMAAFSGSATPPCAPDNAGLKLPNGFCATLFADSLPAPRHVEVAANGDVVVALRGARGGQGRAPMPGGVMVLRDADGDGRAESRQKFGDFAATEVRLLGNQLYTESGNAILRYRWSPGAAAPSSGPDTIVRGLPDSGHAAKTFVIHRGRLIVNQGSRTNACQERDRQPGSKGVEPCPELAYRAGIWSYSAEKKGQTLRDGERLATGVRNAVAMAIEPRSNELYVVQHGRDQLDNFPPFTAEKNAVAPAEELFRVRKGDDYGWPYCYFDLQENKRVLAPEYGGDGKTAGQCQSKQANVGTFPAHWAPNGLLFYSGNKLPEKYRNGAFIVFHGSWNRVPVQEGFRVVFQPMANGRASGAFENFVEGFVGADGRPTELGGRPTGLAQGRNGELYLSDDSRGRIWKITYTGSNTATR